MFQPSIPESLPSYPSSNGGGSAAGPRRILFGSRTTTVGDTNSGATTKMQHLPPPPSPRSPAATLRYGSSSSIPIPDSPAAHLYHTPPTSRPKRNRHFGGRGMDRDGGIEGYGGGRFIREDIDCTAMSPPPLSTFYDGPLDGSLTLQEEEEEAPPGDGRGGDADGLSSYRRDAGFIASGGRKRTYASTLDDDEYYENGRGPMVRLGAGGGDGNGNGGGGGGGGKRRIIDVVGSVASKLWEVVKGTSNWGFYYPGSLLGGVGRAIKTTNAEQQHQEKVNDLLTPKEDELDLTGCSRVSGDYYRLGGLNREASWSGPSSSTPTLDAGSGGGMLDKASLRRMSMTTPSSPTKPRRRANTSFGRNSIERGNNDIDTSGGLRAQWVLVSPDEQDFPSTKTTSTTSRTQRPSSSRSHLAHPILRPTGHVRAASSSMAGGKKRSFRFPAKPITPTSNVVFDFSGNGAGSPGGHGKKSGGSKKKSASGGGWDIGLFGRGGGSFKGGLDEEEDEVDESMRRFNEQLKAMIREGKEALGSTVEVVYED